VLDVDGTAVRGDEPIPGGPAAVSRLVDRGIEPLYVSNNPVEPPSAYVERLGNAGYETTADRVVTAGTVTATYLKRHHDGERTYLVGEPELATQLEVAGVRLVDDPDRAELLVASVDRSFDYGDLCSALWALEDPGVGFVGTDPDVVIPTADRDRPGSGAIINAVAGVAEREPDVVLGKPSEPTRREILGRLDVPPERCLLVGDRLDTDIALGEWAGMATALVRTGVTDDDDLDSSPISPDHVLDSVADIDTLFR